MSCYLCSWKHSHTVFVHFTLLEMLDIFSLYLVVGQFIIPTSVILSTTYSQQSLTPWHTCIPPCRDHLVVCSYNHVRSMLWHEVLSCTQIAIFMCFALVIFLMLLQIINSSVFNLCYYSYSVTWYQYLHLLSYSSFLRWIYVCYLHKLCPCNTRTDSLHTL